MIIGKTLNITDRKKWRAWLCKNHKIKNEIWLIYYKKHTNKARIPYDDAVEEAVCYGWIDSTVKRIDDDKYAQKFTPRREKSNWSDLNIKKAKKLIKEGKMTKIGLALFNKRSVPQIKPAPAKSSKIIVLPLALKKALSKNKKARENFDNFAPGYRQLYIGWISSAKRKETVEKRIRQVIKWSAENIKPGML